MPITHKWNGTVLTITSDSGTSSADLKGQKGDDGARGPQGQAGSTIAENTQKLDGKDAKYYIQPYNQMDNSNFKNFISQAGILGRHGSEVYVGDRWKAINITNATVSSNGLTLTTDKLSGFICQVVPIKAGITYTAVIHGLGNNVQFAIADRDIKNIYNYRQSVLNGVMTLTFTPTDDYIAFMVYIGFTENGGSSTLEWTALYEGEYTAETLPPYIPKGYAVELAECQRYYRRSWSGNISSSGVIGFVKPQLDFSIPIVNWEKPMRITPTVKLYSWAGGEGYIRCWTTSTDVEKDLVKVNSPSMNGFGLTNIGSLTTGYTYAFHYEASADL